MNKFLFHMPTFYHVLAFEHFLSRVTNQLISYSRQLQKTKTRLKHHHQVSTPVSWDSSRHLKFVLANRCFIICW